MNRKYYCLLLLLVNLIAIQARLDPFDFLDFFEYCSAKGYPVEDHVISTEDHYNLRFYRIQGKSFTTQPKTPKSHPTNESSTCNMASLILRIPGLLTISILLQD